MLPSLVERLLPRAFALELYEDEDDLCYRTADGMIECTLRERSLVPRGIPFRLRIRCDETIAGAARMTAGGVAPCGSDDVGIELMGIGCDLRSAASVRELRAAATSEAPTVVARLLASRSTKRHIAALVSSTLFAQLAPVARAVAVGRALEAVGPVLAFSPQRQLYAREGSSEKWLQRVAGYYFASASLQEVRFVGADTNNVTFTFYYDDTEPVNGDPRRANINPEVISCSFGCSQ